ncbi:MAG: hypothetical protein GY822_29630 [Deltaproteobacteria bacterium]|nr:hypothetical protein [Deltaproteobacteria bacterium]
MKCHGVGDGLSVDEHEPFTIGSGPHFVDCTGCHKQYDVLNQYALDYTSFECAECHNQFQMTIRHFRTQDYVYEVSACFECHLAERVEK